MSLLGENNITNDFLQKENWINIGSGDKDIWYNSYCVKNYYINCRIIDNEFTYYARNPYGHNSENFILPITDVYDYNIIINKIQNLTKTELSYMCVYGEI